MKHKLALFDLDGVIVDTAKYHFISWRKIEKCFNYELKVEDNRKLKGLSRADSLNQILVLYYDYLHHKPTLFEKRLQPFDYYTQDREV